MKKFKFFLCLVEGRDQNENYVAELLSIYDNNSNELAILEKCYNFINESKKILTPSFIQAFEIKDEFTEEISKIYFKNFLHINNFVSVKNFIKFIDGKYKNKFIKEFTVYNEESTNLIITNFTDKLQECNLYLENKLYNYEKNIKVNKTPCKIEIQQKISNTIDNLNNEYPEIIKILENIIISRRTSINQATSLIKIIASLELNIEDINKKHNSIERHNNLFTLK